MATPLGKGQTGIYGLSPHPPPMAAKWTSFWSSSVQT